MAWLSIRVSLDSRTAEPFSDALLEAGALSVALEDADAGTRDETPLFGEPDHPSAELWPRSIAVVLVEPDTDIAALLAHAAGIAHVPTPTVYTVEPVGDADWVRLTQSQFDPIPISPRLWIVPTWHDAPDRTALNIRLDPGLAFGTGSHPTTRLCLAWLDRHLQTGETVLDYGCGSGILAIAASRLGASRVDGIDIDPQAVAASRDNALLNQVDARFDLPGAFAGETYDLVVANILTNPLKALAPLLAGKARPGGRLLLSGILAEQAGEIIATYQPWFVFDPPQEDEGWVALAAHRR